MKNVSIWGKGVVVEFPIFDNSHRSLKKAVLHATTGGRFGKDVGRRLVVRGLDEVDFEFSEGDRVGIMGHNGSGKTTLLRVLSGVYEPVRGNVTVRGRVASLLDVSMGLDVDATGLENIYLRGVMAGLKPQMIRARMDDIAEFSGLGEYLNFPVRTYSSGMVLRLGFSISTSVEADILLMDEWLSVGDASFSAKAAKRLEELVEQAGILVLASHSRELIDSLCNRVLRLDHGRCVEETRKESVSAQVA